MSDTTPQLRQFIYRHIAFYRVTIKTGTGTIEIIMGAHTRQDAIDAAASLVGSCLDASAELARTALFAEPVTPAPVLTLRA